MEPGGKGWERERRAAWTGPEWLAAAGRAVMAALSGCGAGIGAMALTGAETDSRV